MPSAPPRFLPSHAASVYCPHFTENRFFVRLRSSQIVWDRPSAPPPIARHSRRIAERFARFRPPNRHKSASKRVVSRQSTPRRARGKKQCSISPDHTEVHPTWHDRTCRQTVKKRPSTPTRSASTSVGRNFSGATFRDIWGHLGTYVPLARPAPPGNALPGASRKSAPARSRTGTRRARNAYCLPSSNTSPFTRGSSPSSHAACSDAYVTLTRSGTARCGRLRSMKCSGHVQRDRACALLEWLL